MSDDTLIGYWCWISRSLHYSPCRSDCVAVYADEWMIAEEIREELRKGEG